MNAVPLAALPAVHQQLCSALCLSRRCVIACRSRIQARVAARWTSNLLRFVGMSVARIYVIHAADPDRYIPEELCSLLQFGGEAALHFARLGVLKWLFDRHAPYAV